MKIVPQDILESVKDYGFDEEDIKILNEKL